MTVPFGNRDCLLPELLPRKGESIVRVDSYAVLPGPEIDTAGRFRFKHPLRKLAFFLFREGLKLTWRKVRSSRLQRKVARRKRVVFVIGEREGRRVAAVGPMDSPGAEAAVFPDPCIAEIPPGKDEQWCLKRVNAHLSGHAEALNELYFHSYFSGKALDFDLGGILAHGPAEIDDAACPTYQRVSSRKKTKEPKPPKERGNDFDLFLAGAGAYAYAYVLPCLRDVRPHTIIDLNPVLACAVAEKFGFAHQDTSSERALKRLADCQAPLLVVATYHSTHLEIVEQALATNPDTKIFLEKPPVTTKEQLVRLLELRRGGAFIEIGYNRRHSPMAREARKIVSARSGPIAMTCIIKELEIPPTHWYFWPTQGTRITGNLSHWLDLSTYIIQQKPVFASVVSAPGNPPGDEASIVVLYQDGSRLTLMSTDKGNPLRGVQEYIDIRRDDLTIQIDDFTKMSIQEGGRRKIRRTMVRDKGHLRMYRHFMENVRQGGKPEYPDSDLYVSSLLYISISEAAVRGKKTVDIESI
ncbi:MAG: Gfo/Idh/MocA family oxidoreductase [Thermodesulfobacteriota bacterium]|nr:Gfo/Idh/MocA family oxidoreductase [Thermodesulfobacteriota bacterium]